MAKGEIRLDDAGIHLRGFGARRLKVLLELSRHPELDDADWQGTVQLHFGNGSSVKAAIHPQAREIAA